MQKNKHFMIFIVICLLICVLCVGLVACDNKNNVPEDENNGGTENENPIEETQLDVQEVKDAIAPVLRAVADFFQDAYDKPYYGDISYANIYYGGDEDWAYIVKQMSKAGVTIEQVRTLAQKAAPVLENYFDIVVSVVNNPEQESGTLGQRLKAKVDETLISSSKDVLAYLRDNFSAEQLEKMQNLFSYFMSWDTVDEFSYSTNSIPRISYPISEIEQLFAASPYKGVYDKYYGCDLALYTIYDSYAELLTSQEGMYLINGLMKAVFGVGGLSNAEIKTVADFIIDVVTGEGAPSDYPVSDFMYVLTNYSTAEIKAVGNAVAKVIKDNMGDEKLNQAFNTVVASALKLQKSESYLPYINIAKALPAIADMLTGVTEEQIKALQSAAAEWVTSTGPSEVSEGRVLATLVEILKPYYDKLAEGEKESVRYILRLYQTDADAVAALYKKPVSQMTDEDFRQFRLDFEETQLNFMDLVSTGKYVVPYDRKETMIRKGTSESEALAIIENAYSNFNIISYQGLDASTTGIKLLTVQATNNAADYTDEYTLKLLYTVYDDAYLSNVYPYDYNGSICRIDVKKGSTVDQSQLVEIAAEQIFGLALYDPAYAAFAGNQDSDYSSDFSVKEVSTPDTSKAGLQPGVITVVDNFFGEKQIPCVINVYDKVEKYGERVFPSNTYVLQGQTPQFYYNYITFEDQYSELIQNADISGYDPNKTGVQVITVNHAGKTFKTVVAVITKQQDQENLNMYNMGSSLQTYRYTEGDTVEDFQMEIAANTLLASGQFYTYGELKSYIENLGLRIEIDMDTQLFNELQTVVIYVKNSDGAIVSSVSFAYMLLK